jgi:hypothetical protein
VDAATPPPHVYAAADYRPQTDHEAKLCDEASDTDWPYLGGLLLLDVASMYSDAHFLKFDGVPGIRMIGPTFVGLTVGATIGGGYLLLPKCSKDWVQSPPPEGSLRTNWQFAVALGLFSGAVAPLALQIENGGFQSYQGVSTREQSLRLVVAGAAGFTGAILPYLLPPKTWRAAKELEKIRAGADAHGTFFTYTLNF